ncbi:MAG: hypothetical protein ABI779_09205 [Acidobacteriota bacterium]
MKTVLLALALVVLAGNVSADTRVISTRTDNPVAEANEFIPQDFPAIANDQTRTKVEPNLTDDPWGGTDEMGTDLCSSTSSNVTTYQDQKCVNTYGVYSCVAASNRRCKFFLEGSVSERCKTCVN